MSISNLKKKPTLVKSDVDEIKCLIIISITGKTLQSLVATKRLADMGIKVELRAGRYLYN